MNFNESFFPKNRLEETEMFIETYETLLSGARKDMENIREELILLDEFESRFDKKNITQESRQELLETMRHVRAQLIQTQEGLKKLHEQREKIQKLIPEDPSLNKKTPCGAFLFSPYHITHCNHNCFTINMIIFH